MATVTETPEKVLDRARTSRSLGPLISRMALRCRSFLSGAGGIARLSLVTMQLVGEGEADSAKPGAVVDWGAVVAGVPRGAKIVLSGEPFESPDFEEVIFEADRSDIAVTVETSGERLEEFAPVIYGLGVAAVRLRLHGPEDAHDAACGGSNAFADAVRGAMALAALSGDSGQARAEAQIPVSVANHSRLAETVECAVGMGAHSVVIRHPSPGLARGLAQDRAFDLAALQGQTTKVINRWPGVARFAPNLSGHQMQSYYSGDIAFGPSKCPVPARSMFVAYDGDVSLCEVMSLGTFDGKPLAETFNSEPARGFRRNLYRGLPKVCSACAGRFAVEEDMA